MALSPGDRLGSYTIVGSLGAGGMGEVYQARDEKLDRLVALKVLHTTRANDPSFRDRFQREARAIAALTHPNIVTVHSIEEHNGEPFLTMELVEGRTLTELMSAGGTSLQTFLQIAIPLADAVAAAHAGGITHRDLKPANVMMTTDGRLKVLDFGLAKLTETSAGPSGFTAMPTEHLTGHGQILGTVAYMSPEQAEGKAVDHRSDIFSLGVILYELATGKKPFSGDTNVSLLSSILRDTPVSVSEVNAAIPREIARLIRRCLEKHPSQRLQSALDLKHELEDLRSEGTSTVTVPPSAVSPPPAPAPVTSTWSGTSQISIVLPPPRRALTWLGAIAAVVALAGSAYWVVTRDGTPAGGTAVPSSQTTKATLTINRLENRTGDASLEPLGQLVADAISQELPRIDFLSRPGASGPRMSAAVTGAYYLDGPNVRIQASLSDTSGTVLYTAEPAIVQRTDSGRAVDLIQQRMLGAIVINLNPDLYSGRLTHTPLYSAYRELEAAFDWFADEPARAVTHLNRAIELDPEFFEAYWLLAAAYSNLLDRERQRETVERMNALRDRLTPFDRARLNYQVHQLNRRRLDALSALRDVERLDPENLVTNYLIGLEAVRLNRPQEAIDEYAKVNAETWNRTTVGRWRYTRLTEANHLLGRHDEELRIAKTARELQPSALGGWNNELAALAALGRMDEIERAVDGILALTQLGGGTPGGSMRVAAEELRAHGRRTESIELAKRAVAWYRNRPPQTLATPVMQLALAQSLYVAEAWDESGKVVAPLLKENPKNSAYVLLAGAAAARRGDRQLALRHAATLDQLVADSGSTVELRRGQLAALVGDRERAVDLLRDAFARGLAMSLPLHRNMDFESLRGYAPFDELMKPKG